MWIKQCGLFSGSGFGVIHEGSQTVFQCNVSLLPPLNFFNKLYQAEVDSL